MSGVLPVCVGRGAALEVLREQWDMVARGVPRVVWVDGEPGVGKTTLVRALLAEGSCRAVWASGDEDETSLSYGLLTTLHAALAQAFGTGGLVGGVPSAASDPLAAGAELLGALGMPNDPWVVVIDDLQWADRQSASALRFALRRLLAEPLLVVLITRPDPGDVLGEPWVRLLADVEHVARVHLDGLTTDGILELVAVTGHGHVGRPVAERLREHTNGSPLHARALMDELGDHVLSGGGVLPAPRSFAQLTVGRVADLGAEAAQLVTAGAVLGPSFSLALAATVGEVTDPARALDRALAAGLLESGSDGEVRFLHPLVRGAVYNDVPASRRRALHLAAAAATTGARSLEHRVAATAGSDDTLAAELEGFAGMELIRGAGTAAYDHFAAAARLSSDARDRDRRLLASVESLMSVGELGRAHGTQGAVLECADSAYRSYILGLLDLSAAAEAHLASAAERANDVDIFMLKTRAIGCLALVRARMGRFEAALRGASTVLETSREGWGSGLMRWVQAICLAQLGRIAEGRELFDRREAERVPGSRVNLDELCGRALFELVDDELIVAEEILISVAERVRAGEALRLNAIPLPLLASVQYRLGRWDEAAMNSDLGMVMAADIEHVAGLTHTVATFVHAGRGRFDLAESDVRAVEEVDRYAPTAVGQFYVCMARAVLAQARHDNDALKAATAPLLDGSVQPSAEGFDRWSWLVLAIEGLLGAAELGAASDRLAELADLVETYELWSPHADLVRLQGQLAEASGDVDAALAVYAAGPPAVAGRLPLPFPAARLELAYGSLLRRTGARRAAIEHLRRAHDGLSSLGATPFLSDCEAELAACGLQAPAADTSGVLQLTPAEEAVARLVSEGLTNREAAAQLYVSPKTVDYHLGHIYAKLGIASRRELVDRLRPGGS